MTAGSVWSAAASGPDNSSPLLEVRDLEVEIPVREGTVHAVNGISYRLERGEVLGIVGESGSGKTIGALSLLRLLPGRGRIVGGEVLFESRDLVKLPLREVRPIRGDRIAMVFQDPMSAMNPVMRIARQITEVLRFHRGVGERPALERARELLETAGIPAATDRMRDYPHQFSGGMRQRAMIAMALACNPALLIADEPTTALDVTVQAQIVDLVQALREAHGMSIIWITHDLGVLAGIADRVLVMYAGKVVEEAPVFELFEQPRHPYTHGLMRSIPKLAGERPEKLEPIGGSPPDLVNYPSGCPFAPRCPRADALCTSDAPLAADHGNGHRVACHHPLGPA